MKLQINIEKLERILNAAKEARKYNDSLSETLEIEILKQSKTHNGDDVVNVIIKSSYSECYGKSIFFN